VRAHETRPAYLGIKETVPNQYELFWRTPVSAGMRLPIVLRLPTDTKDLKPPTSDELTDSLVEQRWISVPGGITQKRVDFLGLESTIADVVVHVELLDGRAVTTIVHPSRPWVFVSLERQNKLEVYEKLKDGTLSRNPLFAKDTLADPGNVRPGQALGTIHMHPNGKFVYLANRASGTMDFEGKPVFVGGENTIAVFAINPETGEPTLIQNVETRGIHVRTFALDPSGRILVAGNMMQLAVRDKNGVSIVPASLAVFRVRSDGKLEFARKYDLDVGSRNLFWMGIVPLP
jgi:hypothetical protein